MKPHWKPDHFNCAAVIVHHTGKEVIRPDGTKAAPNPRGASVIQDIVDVSAFLEKTSIKDVTWMSFAKTKGVKFPW